MANAWDVIKNEMPKFLREHARGRPYDVKGETRQDIGFGDIAETGFDVLAPLGLYASEAEGANPLKALKGGSGALAKALRGGKKAESAAFKLTPDTPAEIKRAVEAPREIAHGPRFKSGEKAGDYRGTEAFGGINPSKLGPMRAQYLRKMEKGAPGRLWYDETSDDIFRLTGEEPAKADDLANMLAITSSRTPVSANAGYGFKGWNQRAVGDEIKTGGFPNAMGRHITEALASPEAAATGLKRNPFSAGLSVRWRPPTSEKGIRPTHDIHDVRAWGIKDPLTGGDWKKGVGEAGHRFLDEQAQVVTDRANASALGGKQDWTPYRSQAASWITQKAEKEGVPIEQAAKHYGDFIDERSALLTREWVPGDNTRHLIEMLRASDADKRGYSEAMENIVRGPQGIDKLAAEMGALSDVTLPNRGMYEGVSNPGYSSRLPVGKAKGSHDIDPASERLVNAIAAGHGLFGTQKQSGWNFLGGPAAQKRAGGYLIDRGTPFNEAELADLQKVTDRVGADIPQVDPRGARVLDFSEEGDAMRKARVKALRGANPDAAVTPMARSGNVYPTVPGSTWKAPDDYSTLPYIERIEAGGPRVVEGFDRAMKTMAPQALAETERWAAQKGWTQAPWFKSAMDALSTGGLAKLKELQKAGVVPAAFVADFTAQQQGEP
jgi:hypothetical protein